MHPRRLLLLMQSELAKVDHDLVLPEIDDPTIPDDTAMNHRDESNWEGNCQDHLQLRKMMLRVEESKES